MKKIYSVLLLTLLTVSVKAASYTIVIGPNNTYAPNTLTVSVGDVVTIQASAAHPVVGVNQNSWNNNLFATDIFSIGYHTATVTFTVTNSNTIYYVCKNHVAMGMKGTIFVAPVGVNEEQNSIGSIAIFPNPAKDNKFSVQLNTTDNVSVSAKLYSVCGQEVETLMTKKDFNLGSSIVDIELQNTIPAGIYFAEFNYNSRKILKKLIIN